MAPTRNVVAKNGAPGLSTRRISSRPVSSWTQQCSAAPACTALNDWVLNGSCATSTRNSSTLRSASSSRRFVSTSMLSE